VLYIFRPSHHQIFICYRHSQADPVAARSEAWALIVVHWIVGSNPAQGMDVCPLSFCVVLSCVGRGLATG
jgi:hypothetical protein